MWVQFYRNEFWSGEANTNNISEGRVGSFKRGLKNVTDGSIFSVLKYMLETYAPNDIQDFLKLNRDSAWENKILFGFRECRFCKIDHQVLLQRLIRFVLERPMLSKIGYTATSLSEMISTVYRIPKMVMITRSLSIRLIANV